MDKIPILDHFESSYRRGEATAGRTLKRGHAWGSVPANLPSILNRLGIEPACWMAMVSDFSRLFRRAAGTPASLAREADAREQSWLQGIRTARELLQSQSSTESA